MIDICFFSSVTLLTSAHWIFSIEYFELSIKFEMILGHVKQEIEAQFKHWKIAPNGRFGAGLIVSNGRSGAEIFGLKGAFSQITALINNTNQNYLFPFFFFSAFF